MVDINSISTYEEAVIACLYALEEDGVIAGDLFFEALQFNVDVDSVVDAYENHDVTAVDFIQSISH